MQGRTAGNRRQSSNVNEVVAEGYSFERAGMQTIQPDGLHHAQHTSAPRPANTIAVDTRVR